MSRPDPRRLRRRVAAAVAVAALLVPYGVTLALLARSESAQSDFASAEADGVTYLRPLVRLVAATADAQSAAVAGRRVDTARLTEARSAVEGVDTRLGGRLGTTKRWDDLGSALDAVVDAGPTGVAGYQAWSRVVDLELALVSAVGDSSNLILDPELDTYYVIDAAMTRLPRMVVTAGRISDLSRLSRGKEHDAADLTGAERAAAGAAEPARAEFAEDAAALDRNLRVAFGATQSPTLGAALLARLDRLRDASGSLVPPGDAFGVELSSAGVQADEQARVQVRDAAVALNASALDEIDGLLVRRLSALSTRLRLAYGLGIAAVVGIAVAAWVLAGPRRRPDDDPDEPQAGPEGPGAAAGTVDDVLLEAEDLLTGRRLVRAGRALSSSRDRV